MSKLIIEKIHDKKTYGKDMYKVVKLIDSDRLSLLNTQSVSYTHLTLKTTPYV